MKDVGITVSTLNTAHPVGTMGGKWSFKVIDKASGVTIVNEEQDGKTLVTQLEDGEYRTNVVRLTAEVGTGGANPVIGVGSVATSDFTVKDGYVMVETAAGVTVEVSQGVVGG